MQEILTRSGKIIRSAPFDSLVSCPPASHSVAAVKDIVGRKETVQLNPRATNNKAAALREQFNSRMASLGFIHPQQLTKIFR